jgi:hypothetical protein
MFPSELSFQKFVTPSKYEIAFQGRFKKIVILLEYVRFAIVLQVSSSNKPTHQVISAQLHLAERTK